MTGSSDAEFWRRPGEGDATNSARVGAEPAAAGRPSGAPPAYQPPPRMAPPPPGADPGRLVVPAAPAPEPPPRDHATLDADEAVARRFTIRIAIAAGALAALLFVASFIRLIISI